MGHMSDGQSRVANRAPRPRPGPNTWLAPAVVVTLCCFSPTGVVAVYFASQVRTLWERDEREAALQKASRARLWVFLSIVLWAVAMVILVATGRAGRLWEAGLI